jgi:hypothetical protein
VPVPAGGDVLGDDPPHPPLIVGQKLKFTDQRHFLAAQMQHVRHANGIQMAGEPLQRGAVRAARHGGSYLFLEKETGDFFLENAGRITGGQDFRVRS